MHSLRRRAAFGIALLTITVVSIHSVVLYSIVDDQEDDVTDQIVSEELDHLVDQYHRSPAAALSRTQFLAAHVVRDERERAGLPSYLRALSDGVHEITLDERALHVGVRSEGDTRFIIVYDVTHREARVRRFGWLLVLGVGFTAMIASLLGYVLAGLVVRPVTQLAERVQRLGPSRPLRPLAADSTEEEIVRLAHAFDGYLDKLAELLEREQEFTANISHELRTPLTSIQTGCELLLQHTALGDAERRRIESIARAAVRIAHTVQALFLLAREEVGQSAPVGLRECIEEAVESVLPVLAEKGVRFELDVAVTEQVTVDRRALLLVLTNLLRNAAGYTDGGFVRVRYGDGVLSVEDSGQGIAQGELPRVFDRFYRGSAAAGRSGSGLGLAIVKRLCDRYGWRVAMESVAGSGTSVRVTLVGQ